MRIRIRGMESQLHRHGERVEKLERVLGSANEAPRSRTSEILPTRFRVLTPKVGSSPDAPSAASGPLASPPSRPWCRGDRVPGCRAEVERDGECHSGAARRVQRVDHAAWTWHGQGRLAYDVLDWLLQKFDRMNAAPIHGIRLANDLSRPESAKLSPKRGGSPSTSAMPVRGKDKKQAAKARAAANER